jgi:hypothetical protein
MSRQAWQENEAVLHGFNPAAPFSNQNERRGPDAGKYGKRNRLAAHS